MKDPGAVSQAETASPRASGQGGRGHPTLNAREKRAYLLQAGVKVYVRRNPDAGSRLEAWIEGDPSKIEGALLRKMAGQGREAPGSGAWHVSGSAGGGLPPASW
jgi:hypothetical protein